jgi:transglutaminase-like putative cysteine protease
VIRARRLRLRLLLRDLGALAAFGAVALSGTIPAPVLLLFLGALLLSLLGKRPFAARPTLSAGVLLVVALVLFGLALRGALDLVVAAASFASLVTAHRLLSEAERRTDHQVLLASLLLLAGGAALSGELWYAVCLFGFATCGSLTLGLGVIEGPAEQELPLPVRPMLRQLLTGLAFALAGGVAFFVLFPRLSWNVAARRTPPGLLGGVSGMSDRVRLGGGGNVKTSPRVVASAQLTPDPTAPDLDGYWIGRHFDVFDGQEWRGSGTPSPARPMVRVGGYAAGLVTQRIELLPGYASRTLIALEHPVSFEGATVLSTSGSAPVALVEVVDEEVHASSSGNGYRYTALSAPQRAAGIDAPPAARYTQLPSQLDPRVAALARRVVGSDLDPLRAARKLEEHLRDGYAYTLELPGAVEDPLADFLFVRKAGHCEHFASALAVMLRTLGIPARVSGGFYGGQRVGDRYLLRAGDAHAWTQVYTPTRGWISLDATPGDGRRGRPSPFRGRLIGAYEALEEYWRRQVVDYSLQDQVAFARALVRPPVQTADNAQSPRLLRPNWSWRTWGLAAGGVVALVILLRRLTRPRPAPPHPAHSFRVEIEARLRNAHVAQLDGEGLEELSARLLAAGHRVGPPLAAATRRYLEARFGGRPLASAERNRLLSRLSDRSR